MTKIVAGVNIDSDLKEQARKIAAQKGNFSFSKLVEDLLREYVEKQVEAKNG